MMRIPGNGESKRREVPPKAKPLTGMQTWERVAIHGTQGLVMVPLYHSIASFTHRELVSVNKDVMLSLTVGFCIHCGLKLCVFPSLYFSTPFLYLT